MNRYRTAAGLAAGVALVGAVTLTSPALAAPTDVHVRIEGVHRTLFDRVVRTDGHAIKATSDSTSRHCDGTNNGYNATPGPTATGAGVDAMSTLGQTFDGDWYPGYDDYFITQFADEQQDSGKGWFWGILVNRVFTPVGGCQFQVKAGDEVLWINNGFNGRPFLQLSGPATAVVGSPVTVQVQGTASYQDTTGASTPYAGATVSPVDANGQPAPAGTAADAVSAANGQATVTFSKTGWQRLKARHLDGLVNSPKAIASNSIDICVRATASAPACSTPPPSQVPAGLEQPEPALTPAPTATPTLTPAPVGTPTTTPTPTTPQAERQPTPTPGPSPAPTAAPETPRPPAAVGPAGRAWKAFFDDRDPAVRRVRGWSARTDAAAWQRTVLRGGKGAVLRIALPAGRPVVLLRGVTRTARVELRAGKQRQVITVKGSRTKASRGVQLRGAPPTGGTLTVVVRSGTVAVDGAGAT